MKGKKRNNAVGIKGRSGRKTKIEELAVALNTGLANYIVNDELNKLSKSKKRTLEQMKSIVMPIALKTLADKTENSQKIEIELIEKRLQKIYESEDYQISERDVPGIREAVNTNPNTGIDIQCDLEEATSKKLNSLPHEIREEFSRSLSDTPED